MFVSPGCSSNAGEHDGGRTQASKRRGSIDPLQGVVLTIEDVSSGGGRDLVSLVEVAAVLAQRLAAAFGDLGAPGCKPAAARCSSLVM